MLKKAIQKVVIVSMVAGMISPIILSTGVSAVESKQWNTDVEQSIVEQNESESVESSDQSKSDTVQENYINELEDVDSNENDIPNEPEKDAIKQQEPALEDLSESSEEVVGEYFSLDENREKAVEMMEQENQTFSTFSMKARTVSKTDAFINAISSYAVSIANEYKLYASVMIAQAALESAWGTSILAYAPNYNLFGIKAGTGEPYFTKYSKEYSEEKGWTVEKSNFKKYPSYKDTFVDYAKKLRNGPDWNRAQGSWEPKRYAGAWKENASTYQAATKALTGKYATDPDYHTKLNDLIQKYNLTQYDKATSNNGEDKSLDEIASISYDEIKSTVNVKDYKAYITGDTDGIYTQPKGTVNSKVVADASQYFNKQVVVTEESTTVNGVTWAKITLNGKVLGWIDKKGITIYDIILSEKPINYVAKISRKTDGINSRPYGTQGYKMNAYSSKYYGKEVKIIKEAVTSRATWALITLNGKELGWIDKNGLSIEKVTSTKNVNYLASVNRKTDGINTKPWGTEGYQLVAMSSQYFGKEVKVTKEAVTPRATWALISIGGKELGWIDKAALTTKDVILSEKDINYSATINRKTDGINTKPWGTEGYQLVAMSSQYFGREVKITKEAVTPRATWALISVGGKELGWIDKAALNIEKITSINDISYTAVVASKTDGINTKPWGTEGYQLVSMSSEYLGSEVQVIKEAQTRRATWALITLKGKELGWIDKNGLETFDAILSEKTVNYVAKINRKTDGINTKPWGTNGYELVAMSSQYVGKEVKVTKEAVTPRATWALISVGGKELGWIDKAGLEVEKITSTKNINYQAKIKRANDGINTQPWGTEGYQLVAMASEYLGKEVKITKEAVTPRATWALISLNGKELGWIDKAGLEVEKITSTKNINYQAKIKRSNDGINTKPWGTEGYELVSMSSAYLGKEIKVIREAVTPRATWALISLNGKELGWIDKNGLDIEKITSQTNVADYKARIVRTNDGINTMPWGTEGYKTAYYSKDYFGAEITVKEEAKTRRATWALIAFNGKELGWIDKAALKKLDPNKKVVVIDAGHGGSDPGAQRVGVKEKDLNLSVAKKVQSKLKAAGYEVIMTRTNDTFIALSERARIANISNADIFVSIHTNSFNGITSGIETFSYDLKGNAKNPLVANDRNRMLKSNTLSSSIQNSLISTTNARTRGAKKANFHVIRETGMPAVLTEIGFIDNTTERNKLVTNSYQEKLANGITSGIKEYFRLVK
ncbi:GW dipeptide domain-containing protein [Desemzia incerta]|uniref:GW dipeptide domain-containing protein n=1 Tax=Desemzia incerta TaxID=82801 RepID=UPI00331491EF